MAANPSIVWFRNDLRLEDQPALAAALLRGRPVVPVYIHAPGEEEPWAPGSASRWWLHQSLTSLAARLEDMGSRLVVRSGPTASALRELLRETGADAVFWCRRYEPTVVQRDRDLEKELKDEDVEARSYNGSLLFEPWEVKNKQGEPYRVFTPFYKACFEKGLDVEPLAAPASIPAPATWPESLPLEALNLEPAVNWAGGLREAWSPGETGAGAELERFINQALGKYHDDRNRPDRNGSSRMSPHLHFGEISPRTIWHRVETCVRDHRGAGLVTGGESYLREVAWREFAYHLLYHYPHTTEQPLREEFRNFPWKPTADRLRAWQKGETGYPIVDAGMRQLWETGWMHNRVRMVVASFLVKDLLIPWQDGAAWFWDTLVDADLANNTLGWQWTAGCGADAAPFFRVFNPVLQGQKFDPAGDYVRRYVPELAKLPARFIHEPWTAPAAVLGEAGVSLGQDYPKPIVDHAEARDAALEAYGLIKGT